MNKRISGFTIVELLIVIVVIAILATISVVAYNGIQDRGKDAKTITAVSTYAKAISLYYIDNNSWPNISCLGDAYPAATGGEGECGQAPSWVRNSSFYTQLGDYIKSFPTPEIAYVVNNSDNSNWRRGAFFGISNGEPMIWFNVNANTCPSVSGLKDITNTLNDSDGSGHSCRGAVIY